ncbi:MAG: type II toxin-antitoxin system PemK/MazF family toxin [Clostridiales bacterium]|nr:type II toxin-antitoxin system PemK/MazF family toxin [Clostridiales bacterium]
MKYTPKHGDIVFLEFDPQAGHEQKSKRPALIVSNNTYNQFTNMSIVCPIMSNVKKFPLHVKLDERTKTMGVIMCEQVKALDVKARKAEFYEKLPNDILEEVLEIILSFIEVERA